MTIENAGHLEEETVDPEISALETELENRGAIGSDPARLPAPPAEEEEAEPEAVAPTPDDGEEAVTTEEEPVEPTGAPEMELDEDGLPVVPEGKTPTPAHWQKARERMKQIKQEKADLARQLESKQTPPVETRAEPAKATSEPADPAKDAQAVAHLISARAGAFGDAVRNKEIERMAVEVIDSMNPKQLLSLLNSVKTGAFGENGAQAKSIITEALAVAQARESLDREEDAEVTRSKQAFESANAESFANVRKNYKDLTDEKSAFYKFFTEWRKKNVYDDTDPKNLKPMRLAAVLQSPHWPEILAEQAHHAFLAGQALGYKRELEALKAKSQKARSPDGGGNRPSKSSSNAASAEEADEEMQQIEAELKAKGNIRV